VSEPWHNPESANLYQNFKTFLKDLGGSSVYRVMNHGYQVSSLERSAAYLPFSRLCYWNAPPRKSAFGPQDEDVANTTSSKPAREDRITDGLMTPLEQPT
jgi:hypothetical protein